MNTKYAAMMICAAMLLAACGKDDAEQSSASMAEKAEEATDTMAESAENAMDNAKDMASNAADAVGEAADDAMEAAKDVAGDMADAAGDVADSAGEMASDAMDAAKDAAGDAMDAAKDVVDGAGEAATAAGAAAAGAMADAGGSEAAADDGDPCTIVMKVGDSIAYETNSLSVPSSCDNVTVTVTHTGTLPKAAMGHNWVLVPADAVAEIGTAAMSLSAEQNYLPEDDRIVAATELVGAGESSSVTFALSDLQDGVEYNYVCTFLGHWSAMRGTFTVSG